MTFKEWWEGPCFATSTAKGPLERVAEMAWNAALEEAALKVESHRKFGPYADWDIAHNNLCARCADAIRKLKEPRP